MKRLKLSDLAPEDSLQFEFEGSFDSEADLESGLEPFFQALETYSGAWMPDVVEGKRQRRYTRSSIWKSFEEERDETSASIVLGRTQWPAIYLWPRLHFPPLPERLGVSLEVQPLSFFAEVERCHHFVEMVRAWATHHPVSYASAHSAADAQLSGAPYFGREEEIARKEGFDKIHEVFWLNVFGPRLVERVGRERLLSTPAHRVEALPHGAVLLVTWPSAADFASDGARLAQARALVHLRPELDLSTVLGTLRERSAALAPVEPRFHPDVAPLLSRTLEALPLGQHPRQIAEYNAWRPPEPEEWAPAEAALPPNIDVERALATYRSLADNLVVMLHDEVPSVFGMTPESLTDIDHHLWRFDFPRRQPKQVLGEHLLPALGAYLGEVLVRQLGGQWLPRETLRETQVRVGPRIWFPMRRAWSALQSRQSLLDYSLTQLYRTAERHRANGSST